MHGLVLVGCQRRFGHRRSAVFFLVGSPRETRFRSVHARHAAIAVCIPYAIPIVARSAAVLTDAARQSDAEIPSQSCDERLESPREGEREGRRSFRWEAACEEWKSHLHNILNCFRVVEARLDAGRDGWIKGSRDTSERFPARAILADCAALDATASRGGPAGGDRYLSRAREARKKGKREESTRGISLSPSLSRRR